MKKGFGLHQMLILSVSGLALIIIIAIACLNLSSGSEPAINSTTYSTAKPTQTQVPSLANSSDNAENPQSSTTDSDSVSTNSPDAGATEEPAGDEQEPELAEATPEPDMDPDTWDYIKGGDYNMIYTDSSKPKKMPYEIRINKQMNCVTVYKPNKKGKYTKPYKAMVCSTGRATPLGTFRTSDKYYWKAMIHGVWAQYATRITGSILFHSVPYDTHEKNTLISRYYNMLGSTASAGCVRLCVRDAKWIIENCPAGTKVTVYNDSNPGPLGKPSPIRIAYDCRWDPTDPDKRNPLNKKKSVITGVKDRTIERGASVDLLQGIYAYDKHSGAMSGSDINIKSDIEPSKPGTYKVTYSFKDSKGKKIKKSCAITIVDTQPPVISGLPKTLYAKDISSIDKNYVTKSIKLTDNGMEISKKDHMTVSVSGNTYTINAQDDYGHSSSFTFTAIKDNESPVLTLKDNLKNQYPVTQKIDKDWATKRISEVSDDHKKLKKSDVSISIKPSGWGMKITYSVKDDAGNTTSSSEKITFETASIELKSDSIIVENADDPDEFKQYVKVTSDVTGKKVPYKLNVKTKVINEDEEYTRYKVTIIATYSSSAGKKTTQVTTTVNETY